MITKNSTALHSLEIHRAAGTSGAALKSPRMPTYVHVCSNYV